MASEEKKRLLGLPSWGLSLIVGFFTGILLIFLGYLLPEIFGNENFAEVVAFIIYALIISTACFLICKNNPKSIWYAPILCNITGIISAVAEPTFWETSLWIAICGGWLLSLISGISGMIAGRRSL
jgi:hypothetical protein